MDSYEATRIVFSRIQNLDPENASKIMGYLLIQDHGEKEMIRLAFGPEALIHSLILKAKTHLGLSISNPPTPSTPSSPSPFSSRLSPLSIPSSRLTNTNTTNGFEITNASSPSTNTWPPLSRRPISPSSNSSLSYASIVNGTSNSANGSGSLPSIASCGNTCNDNEFIGDYQFQDHLSFLNDSKPEDFYDPRLDLAMSPTGYADSPLHRRSFSVPGLCFGAEDVNSGVGWKPCLYFARGFCKNGTSCRFVHGDCTDGAVLVGSPSKLNELEQCQGLLRSKALQQQQQQQKLAAASQFMAGPSFPYSKCVNFLLQQQNDSQRSAAAALMMGDELHKFGRCRSERNDFAAMGLGAVNPGSRQIYLTFPADSTFKEEDVSSYFSIYGPVQDVRIPYQQKRMFGFVTFVYPETVKLILAKGNPHFVCDSRVLVKPYKEKGKVQEKKQQHQQQQLERGEYSACSSPSALDSREPFDLHLGPRMFYNTQEMLLRRKLEEQADLRQAIEFQERRLMNLQLLDLKNHYHSQFRHGLSTGSPIPSPTVSHTPNDQALIFPADGIDQEVPEENGGSPVASVSILATAVDADKQQEEVNPVCNHKSDNGNSITKEEKANIGESDLPESLEHILPDNLFASPKKSAGDHPTVFSTASVEVDDKTTCPTTSSNSNPSWANSSSLNMTSLKSCFLQMPRFSSGQGTIGM
ncbi:zinc finger CCCH domain-containing protein 53-like isoform X1 [Durio zibethinus]|uniref:Zinc finger CCCH domain-containing protein 53-like isoform X1 n=1 Tax=Durio zibethinus TaxID=66656 RepID=A0A6P5ZUM4_DURZI|nr:zinc finger CCCH domain-containing protein 53-like isoform X1 [Durio zibethinus]XP_022756227.1 zinc finger CCCH domain-containing protein 53-like isoform X1 [Durio zibethinus]